MPYRKTLTKSGQKNSRPRKATIKRKKGGFLGLSMGNSSLKRQAKKVTLPPN